MCDNLLRCFISFAFHIYRLPGCLTFWRGRNGVFGIWSDFVHVMSFFGI